MEVKLIFQLNQNLQLFVKGLLQETRYLNETFPDAQGGWYHLPRPAGLVEPEPLSTLAKATVVILVDHYGHLLESNGEVEKYIRAIAFEITALSDEKISVVATCHVPEIVDYFSVLVRERTRLDQEATKQILQPRNLDKIRSSVSSEEWIKWEELSEAMVLQELEGDVFETEKHSPETEIVEEIRKLATEVKSLKSAPSLENTQQKKPVSFQSRRKRGPNTGTLYRVAKAMVILEKNSFEGTMTNACDQAGISPKTFKRYRDDPDHEQELEELMRKIKQEENW